MVNHMIDDFFKEVYCQVYKLWILNYQKEGCRIYSRADDQVMIETEYGLGSVMFHPLNIMELTVIHKSTQKIELYLHFQMKNFKHAVDLFYELIDTIEKLMNQPKIKILLSCSGGLTTMFFAEKINEASNIMNFNYEAEAVAYTKIYEVADDYDVVLLAPQISYMLPQIQKMLEQQIVLTIPAKIFGTYDVAAIFHQIDYALANKKAKQKKKALSLKTDIEYYETILSIAIIRTKENIVIAYRVYAPNYEILMENDIVKEIMTMDDIFNTIDTILALYPSITKIGFSSPGIIQENYIRLPVINGLNDLDIGAIKAHYKQKIIFGNDVNTAITGYYYSMKQGNLVSLLFYPQGLDCGVGTIIDGQLIKGHKNFAGEVKFLPHNIENVDIHVNRTPEEIIEHLSKVMASMSCVIAPETIVVCCRAVTDMKKLKESVMHYIPEEYMPTIELINNHQLRDYSLLGQLVLCLKR